ncbi:MAG TPA: tetratricopeptide repeat protein, partial [Methanothrix sp.]|nr:tetratricopeptide repeat protein [Methanothrix sp.]
MMISCGWTVFVVSEDRVVSCLESFAKILADPKGYDPERLKGLSQSAPDPVSSFILATLSSDEAAMQCKFQELADHVSCLGSFSAWFNLALLARSLFFHQAAIEYYERALHLAEVQYDKKRASLALSGLGKLYAEVEDWERSAGCYKRAHQCLIEAGQPSEALTVL